MAPDMSLAVTDVGSGHPILLVHGQPGSRADWSSLIPLLSGEFRVLAVDRPGYGESGGEAVGLLENASLLWRLLEERSAVGATIVGHSLGAGIALAMAERALGAGALVLVGTAGVDGTVGALDHLLALPLAGSLGVSGVRSAAHVLRRFVENPSVAAIDGWGSRAGPSFTREQRALLRERDLLEAGLDAIAVPTTVVVGSHDRIVRPSAQRALAARIPGGQLVELPGAGHLIPLRNAPALAAIVRAVAAANT
jgi:pimeloyl-ACP methyl ester carboxylesterase